MAREFEELRLRDMGSLLEREEWDRELVGRLLDELAARRANSESARDLRARLLASLGESERARARDFESSADSTAHAADSEPPHH